MGCRFWLFFPLENSITHIKIERQILLKLLPPEPVIGEFLLGFRASRVDLVGQFVELAYPFLGCIGSFVSGCRSSRTRSRWRSSHRWRTRIGWITRSRLCCCRLGSGRSRLATWSIFLLHRRGKTIIIERGWSFWKHNINRMIRMHIDSSKPPQKTR